MTFWLLLPLLCGMLPAWLGAQTVGGGWQQLPGPAGGDVRHLSQGLGGTLWAGTSAGLYARAEARWRKLAHTPFGQQAVERAWPVAGDRLLVLANGTAWMGSEHSGWEAVLDSLAGLESDGQQHWAWQRGGRLRRSTGDPSRWDVFDAPAPLGGLALDGQGQVWLAAADTLRLWTGQPTAWTEASAGLDPAEPHEAAAAWAATADTLYVATTAGQVFARARTADRWERRTEADPLVGGLSALLAHGGRLYSGSARGTLRRSADGGRTWQAVLGLPSADSLYCLLAVGGHVLAGSYRSGVLAYRSDPPADDWNAGLTAATAEHIAWIGDRIGLAAVRDVGLFRSDDGGQTWAPASAGLGFTQQLALLSAGGRVWVAGLGLERIYESRDTATTWRGIGSGLPDFGATSLLWRPSDRRLLAGTPRLGVHAWNGIDWRPLPALGLPPNPSIRSLALDPDDQVVAAVSGQGIFRYRDDLERWEPLAPGLPSGLVQGIWRVGDSLLAAAAERLLVWRGTQWAELRRFRDSAGEPVLVSGLAAPSAGTFVVGTRGLGCWQARADSAAGWLWEPLNDGLFNPVVLDVQAAGGGDLVVSTAGDGLFRWRLATDPDSVIGRPRGWAGGWLRLYPNPADQSVSLTYRWPRGYDRLVLEVFDPLGRRVLHRQLDAASGIELVETSSWVPGLYVFRLNGWAQKVLIAR